MRCMTLAELLRERGAGVRFVCRALGGHLIDSIRSRDFAVAALPAPTRPTETAGDDDYAAWLGVSQEEDAAATIAAIDVTKPDWLIADHYSLDMHWERSMRPHASGIAVIDDLASRPHDCDVLLNQNYSKQGPERYVGRVPEKCRLLLGPGYALLRPEFARHRRLAEHRERRVRRIFIFLGGTDQGNVTGLALDALSVAEFAGLEVDVVVGKNNPHRESLAAKVTKRPNTTVHEPTTRLAELMARTDLAIGAGGGTTWERLCLGVPSLVVSIAPNQVPACEDLSDSGLIRYLGPGSSLNATTIREALGAMIESPGELAVLTERGQLAVDGWGAARVAECLAPTPLARLQLRRAAESDALLYYHWVNDAEVRRQSLGSGPIPWARHQAWFSVRQASDMGGLFVMEAAGLPVGQIRFDRVAAETCIDYSIDPLFRGRGWASRLLELGLLEMIGGPETTFRADVKDTNPASRAVFAKQGFVESEGRPAEGVGVFRLTSAARRRKA